MIEEGDPESGQRQREALRPGLGRRSGAAFGLKSHCVNAEARAADFEETTAPSNSLPSKPPDKVPSSAVDHGVLAIPAIWRARLSWSLQAVQPGKTIANLFAALLLASLVGGVFFVFGRPLWPERRARMVILLPIDTIATGSVRKACLAPCLPARFDLKLAPARPPG